MEKIRVLIADDHPLFRDGLRALLNSMADTEVVGEAKAGDEAIEQAAALQPDIVLMDINMPCVNGIEATRRIVQTSPHMGVLVVTMFEDDDSVFAAMRAGARGYLLKGADQAEVLDSGVEVLYELDAAPYLQFTLDWLTEAEVEESINPLGRLQHEGVPVLVARRPDPHPYLHNALYYGILRVRPTVAVDYDTFETQCTIRGML